MLKAAAAIGVAAATSRLDGAAAPGAEPAKAFYYVDGYHGGVDGHMPADSLRNVMDGLDRSPMWKVSFEIEPYSWAVFAKSDPDSIERLRRHLKDGRVEMVSGAYGQPYAWNTNGECNIRHLQHGRAELRTVFPDVLLDTYAVQEPCWTSCLPQLLKSLGYRRAVLKNSTCWGGYHAGIFDADLVQWTSSDGASIPTVPRYACEKLVGPATIESAKPSMDFLARCTSAGIKNPAGTILQDMGWPGHPWRLGINDQVVHLTKHVTWREYVDTIAEPATHAWNASQEDIRVGLAWGASILQRIAQVVRASENQLAQAEKIAALAWVSRKLEYPGDDLKQAWKLLLWSQHHDVWIVPFNRHKDGTWASAADSKREMIDRACQKIVEASTSAMSSSANDPASDKRSIRVFNTTGFRRRDIASVEIPANAAGRAPRVRDGKGNAVPCQLVPGADEKSPATLLFSAEVPATGYSTYTMDDAEAPPSPSLVSVGTKADGTVVLESDHYTLSIDPAKGGKITSLFSKTLHREFVDAGNVRGFGEFRGHFANAGGWLSSTTTPATVKITEQGPLRATALISGHIGDWPFTAKLSLVAGCPRIDFETTFEFPAEGRRRDAQAGARFRVGEPWENGRDVTGSNRRPFYDSSYKLLGLFPAALKQPTLYKNAAFDVCKTTERDTRFNAWDQIKNNVVLNWVDLVQDDGSAGLAVITDQTTAYNITPDEPLGLVCCYAGPGVWVDYNLVRQPRIAYSIVPHAGDWAQSRLCRQLAGKSERLIATFSSSAEKDAGEWSLIDATETGVEITAILRDEDNLLIRLFNADGDAAPRKFLLSPHIEKASLVELDGRMISDLPLAVAASGRNTLTLAMPRFAVRTLSCKLKTK